MQIKENLKKCREKKGLSTLKLAKEIDIDETPSDRERANKRSSDQ